MNQTARLLSLRVVGGLDKKTQKYHLQTVAVWVNHSSTTE